jgi:aminopeptidase N
VPVARPDQAFPDLGDPELDVSHYALALDYDVARRALRGRATITATVLVPTDSVRLDLRGLDVSSVQVDGSDAPHRRTDRAVEITLPERTPPGEEFRVVIDYDGIPAPVPTAALDGVEVGWHASSSGSFVVAEPEGASTWFPVNNHPATRRRTTSGSPCPSRSWPWPPGGSPAPTTPGPTPPARPDAPTTG